MTSASGSIPASARALRLLETSHELFASVADDGSVLWCNPAWERRFGSTCDGLAERLPAVAPGEHADVELVVADRWYAVGVTGDPEEPVRHLVARDAAPSRADASEEDATQSRRLLEALSLSVARYRTLVRNLPDTIVTLYDHDLRYHLAEGAGLARHGLTEGDFVWRTPVEVHGVEHGLALEAAFRGALAGTPQELEWRAPDGTLYAHHVVPLLDGAGEAIGGMGVARDITELKAAEAQREAHTAELERSNAELAQFAYVASHDLSEPLRMITSYLQLVQRRYAGRLDADADDFIAFAVDGGARMRRLIDDLLAYSRVGRKEQPFEAVDVAGLVEQVSATIPLGVHEDDDVVVEVGDLPAVQGDPTQLGQLFQNLIGNAVKFVPAERTARVRVLAEPQDSGGPLWRFTVADNGIGIDPEHADRVFGMFQRLHAREEYEGTGIGLAIAKKVVERHGGRIWLDPSPPEGGACFHFTLPAAVEGPAA